MVVSKLIALNPAVTGNPAEGDRIGTGQKVVDEDGNANGDGMGRVQLGNDLQSTPRIRINGKYPRGVRAETFQGNSNGNKLSRENGGKRRQRCTDNMGWQDGGTPHTIPALRTVGKHGAARVRAITMLEGKATNGHIRKGGLRGRKKGPTNRGAKPRPRRQGEGSFNEHRSVRNSQAKK